MFDVYADDLDFENFEKFHRAQKNIKNPNIRKNDHQIRTARREKEKARQSLLEEFEATE